MMCDWLRNTRVRKRDDCWFICGCVCEYGAFVGAGLSVGAGVCAGAGLSAGAGISEVPIASVSANAGLGVRSGWLRLWVWVLVWVQVWVTLFVWVWDKSYQVFIPVWVQPITLFFTTYYCPYLNISVISIIVIFYHIQI